MKTNASTAGTHHVGLTVTNLGQTLDFLTGRLGWSKVGETPDYPAAFVCDGPDW